MSDDPTTDGGIDLPNSDATASSGPAGGAGGSPPEWLSLDAGEEIVWAGEPSIKSVYGTVITGVVLVPVLLGFLVLLGLPFSYLSIKNTDYVVTNQSLYVKKGVASTNIETVDIDKLQNTEYSQSFWGKQLGFGNIEVSTAGSSGADITFRSIENAREVRETISDLSSRGRSQSRSRAEGEHETAGASADQLEELVAELRATREAMERIDARLADAAAARSDAGTDRERTGQSGGDAGQGQVGQSTDGTGETSTGPNDSDAESLSSDGDSGSASDDDSFDWPDR